MKAVSFLMVGLAAGAGFGALACGNGDDSFVPPPVTKVDAGPDASHPDATIGDDGGEQDAVVKDATAEEGEAAPTLALLRLANWSADSPAIDFCLAPHGTGAFQGPILGATAAAIDDAGVLDAGSGALSFPQASSYLVVDPAQYDARLVAAGSTDCSAMIIQDATGLPELVRGAAGTIALVGATQPRGSEPGLQIVGFRDDLKSALPTAFLLRAINAAPDLPKVDIGTLNGGLLQKSLRGVPFGGSSAGLANVGGSSPDPDGYVPQTPFVNAILAASPSVATFLDGAAGSIIARTSPISVGVGAILTIVVVGASGQTSCQIVECVDNGGTPGLVGNCQILSQ